MQIKLDFFRYLMLLLILWLVAGCKSFNGPNILVGTDDCKPPCWIKVQPGITQKEDMLQILSEKEKNKDGKLTQLESGITWWQSATGYNSYFYLSDSGLISKIDVDLRQTKIYLGDVIDVFGMPSKLDIGKISDGYFFATIFYPDRGLAFVIGGNNLEISSGVKNYPIDSDMLVMNSLFFQPSDVDSMVNLLYGVNAVPQALSDIQDWNGYGVYNE